MGTTSRPTGRRLAAGLFVTAPVVAEFVSGNLPIIYLWLLIVYMPFYGGAAVLIRELGRRAVRPWPVIVTLGLAFGVFEEAFVSFSLFNPDYAGLRLLDFGWIPQFGIGAWWTMFVVVLHAVWSVCVPIVLVESFAGDLDTRPWLHARGMILAGSAMALGAALLVAVTVSEDEFVPSVLQLTSSGVVVVSLLGIGAWLARRPAPASPSTPFVAAAGTAPRPMVVGASSAVAGFLFVVGAAQAGPAALTVIGYAALFVVVVVVVIRWSRRPGWGASHRLALATGVLVPHVAFAFAQSALVDVPLWVDIGGDVFFALVLGFGLVRAWAHVGGPRARAADR